MRCLVGAAGNTLSEFRLSDLNGSKTVPSIESRLSEITANTRIFRFLPRPRFLTRKHAETRFLWLHAGAEKMQVSGNKIYDRVLWSKPQTVLAVPRFILFSLNRVHSISIHLIRVFSMKYSSGSLSEVREESRRS